MISLLVVGMQVDKVGAMRLSSAHQQQLVRAVNSCVEMVAQRGGKIIYALDLHHPKHSSFVNGEKHCVLGTLGAEPVVGLHFGQAGSDIVFRGLDRDGDSSDAFWITEPPHEDATESRLGQMLRHHCTQLLIVCGASPDGCIESTVASARLRAGALTICVPLDATALATSSTLYEDTAVLAPATLAEYFEKAAVVPIFEG